MVEYSPATRVTRVQFPVDAHFFILLKLLIKLFLGFIIFTFKFIYCFLAILVIMGMRIITYCIDCIVCTIV